MSPALISTLR